MSKLEIVAATAQDIPVIHELIYALAEYEKLTQQVVATPERLRETLFGSRPAAEVVLARWDGECAGFAVYFETYSTFLAQPGLYLEDLYVKPHFRGKGIGYALLRQLARVARERGCGRLEWEVLDWNEPSIRFYKKLGAVALDDWTRYRLTSETLQRLAQ
jgi:GNAT superfamily N-acetyltransferase